MTHTAFIKGHVNMCNNIR